MAFVDEIENAVERARRFPEIHRRIRRNVRRILTRKFSYAVIYEIGEDRIFIWAVAHTSREPGYWKARLQT
jgi:plasmid stabilization system protein ParE